MADAIEFQRRVVDATGGVSGVLNHDRLQAALERPFQSAFGVEPYPTPADKVAVLIHSIITTHPFVDGNKRTAMRLGLAILQNIGQRIRPISNDDVESLALAIAKGERTIDEVTAWINDHYQC